AAVDAWRAAQPDPKAPTDRLSATESQDQGADDGADTEGSQAQGGARRDSLPVGLRSSGPTLAERAAAARAAPPAPAGPAGLDAAIEAAARALGAKHMAREACAECVDLAVRAAAPHLRAVALNEAADEAGASDWAWLRIDA